MKLSECYKLEGSSGYPNPMKPSECFLLEGSAGVHKPVGGNVQGGKPPETSTGVAGDPSPKAGGRARPNGWLRLPVKKHVPQINSRGGPKNSFATTRCGYGKTVNRIKTSECFASSFSTSFAGKVGGAALSTTPISSGTAAKVGMVDGTESHGRRARHSGKPLSSVKKEETHIFSGNDTLPLSDIEALIGLCRPSSLPLLPQSSVPYNVSGEGWDEFHFIPEFLLALLLSHFKDEDRLRQILRADWVKEWNGWTDARKELMLDEDLDDVDIVIASEYVQRFARLVMQNVHIEGKSDAVRRAELEGEGRIIGHGFVHANNECCADSLLQLLALRGYVVPQLATNIKKRRDACRACRAFLNAHEDPKVWPRVRTATGEIADVAEEHHRSAFLQHDLHAELVVRYFMEHHGNGASLEPCGLRLTVFTRWDSVALPPASMVFGRATGVDADAIPPPMEIELYSNTGDGCVGYHYDPMWKSVPPPPVQPEEPRPRRKKCN